MNMTLAIFRIEDIKNDSLQTAANVALLILGVIYLATIFWTFADARRRIDDPLLVVCGGTLDGVLPDHRRDRLPHRPPARREFLDDVRLRELEWTAAKARLASLDYSLCPHCDYEVQSDYLRCPSCMRKLKERCYSCSKPIYLARGICPFCEASSRARPRRPPRTRRRRRQTTDQATVAAEIPEPEPAEAGTGGILQRAARDERGGPEPHLFIGASATRSSTYQADYLRRTKPRSGSRPNAFARGFTLERSSPASNARG